ncbi:GNAT family N-acetyltransferase [uncultured Psychroserpens sp.]|uniref:GNAT family N-acetyltransferase n=1 Tax=uncultured Psychroserpens sp. TaxID=255436 RepID=UPI0026378467|nr:GNAT family N-acetyltransferase [uncultured Psychroserpens sp.]
MNFIKTNDFNIIQPLRQELYDTFTTALDSMWESLYIGSSTSYLIQVNTKTIGYCCIDNDKSLTQIYIKKPHLTRMQDAITSLIDLKLIVSAKLSSIEPVGFNTCLIHASSVKNNTYCFQFENDTPEQNTSVELTVATNEDVEMIQSFYKTQVGFEDTFGYTENLVKRQELFIVKNGSDFVGTGECRLSDSQPRYADVGVAIHSTFRRQGYASQTLHVLAKKALTKHRKPICSTTIDNIGSKKAIEKAGFHFSHSIFDLRFVS